MEKYYVVDEEGNKVDFINDIVCTFKTDDGTKYVTFTDYKKMKKVKLKYMVLQKIKIKHYNT